MMFCMLVRQMLRRSTGAFRGFSVIALTIQPDRSNYIHTYIPLHPHLYSCSHIPGPGGPGYFRVMRRERKNEE